MKMTKISLAFRMVAALGIASGCGGRPSYWNDPVSTNAVSYGLQNGVALVDDAAHRVVILTARSNLDLTRQALPIGHQVVSVSVSQDGTQLFVLSAGDWPRRTASDESPSLTVIDVPGNGAQAGARLYPMPKSEPLANLALDPQGTWAVAYAGTAAGAAGSTTAPSIVENPNEIVLFDLNNPFSTVTRTLRSFGGTPQRLVFTPELQLPTGKTTRLLLIETNIDLTMLDLGRAFDASPPPEITVPLTTGTTAAQVTPAGLAVAPAHVPLDPNDARFALWASNDTEVFTLQLVAPTAGLPNDFSPTIYPVDVGGIPTDVAFVETQGVPSNSLALRIAALVPSRSSAVLVDPDTSATTTVSLPAGYANLSLVTGAVVSAPASADVALLWNAGAGATSGVALWSLGTSLMQPYRSVRTVGTTQPIQNAIDVPKPNQFRKILQMTSGSGFYVLDLVDGTAPPLTTSATATLTIAPDGGRLWAFDQGGTDLAAIDFDDLNPTPLTTDLGISAVYDIRRADGGRALVAMHAQGGLGATVFDALSPVTASSRRVASLLVEGL